MDNDLEILKEIGANKIHDDTHISREFIQAILHESFEDIQSVQFYGFVSILEKTYNVDLVNLRAKAKEHFKETDSGDSQEKKIFVIADRKKSNNGKYFLLALVLVLAFFYYSFIYVNSIEEEIPEVDNTKIENVQKNLNEKVAKEPVLVLDTPDINTSIDTNMTKQETLVVAPKLEEKVAVVQEPKEAPKTLKILPKRRTWAGYINIKTNQKYQKVFQKDFALDTSKNWLLLFGAGTIYLEVNGEEKKYSSRQNMRFKYVNGEFSKISVTEFKRFNKGRKW